MSTTQFLLLVCASLYQVSTCQHLPPTLVTCVHEFSIQREGEGNQPGLCQISTNSERIAAWNCADLQSALITITSLDLNSTSPPGDTVNCVTISVPPGLHLITAPVHLGSANVQLVGLGQGSDMTTVQCNYTVDVDETRIFDPEYSYVDYTVYLNRSEFFTMSNMDFMDCPYPFRFDTLRSVVIRNSSFENHSEAVFDIFNCANIFINNSMFTNNRGTGISRTSFRANTGAVSIGFNNINTDVLHPLITISGCKFVSNRATAPLRSFRTTSSAFFNRVFTGRGGGLGIFVNESIHNITGTISDNAFVGNFARSFGGGLYIVVFGDNTQNLLLVERNVFEDNLAILGGGGFIMTFFSNGIEDTPHQTNITDCFFSGNSGESGGALLIYLAYDVSGFSFFKLERCNFTHNYGIGSMDDYGSAFASWLVNNIRDKQSIPENEIIDCIFEGNNGTNGIVSVGYVPVGFHGRNLFVGNNGTSSLRIIGSLVDVLGYMEFTGNRVGSAAALELLSFGQIRIHTGLRMYFTGNVGRFGASISSNTATSSGAFEMLAFNAQCFIIFENPAIPPPEWTNVSIVFQENEAVLASSLYILTVESCAWFSLSYPFFDRSYILKWPLWDFRNDNRNTGYQNPYLVQHQVQSAPEVLETSDNKVIAWPGQRFNVSITAWDAFRNPTTASSRFVFQSQRDSKSVVDVMIRPEVVIIEGRGENSTLTTEFVVEYTATSGSALNSTADAIGNVNIDVLFEVNTVSGDQFTLFAALCPGGYEVVSSPRVMCRCKESVSQVLNCEDDQDSIIIQNGFWVSTVASDDLYRHVMSFHTCPAGYCRCFQNSSLGEENCVFMFVNSYPDSQCDCSRHGVLCGDCKDGLGVSALFDNCVTCSNLYGILILILIVVDTVLLVFFIIFDKTLPAIFYSLTFYIQTITLTFRYFPDTFEVVGQYLFYISSIMGLYFPYDFCLYDNMSPLVSYFIKLIPCILAIIVGAPTSILLRKSHWQQKLRFCGVWLVIILLYSHTVYTSMSVLKCSYISVDSNETTLRWFVNGNITCFTGGHLPLALLAIILLLLSTSLIPISAMIAMDKVPKRVPWMKSLRKPLVEAFKERYRWWSAVELSRRFACVLFIVLFPRNQVFLLLVLCVFLVLYGYIQPYKSDTANIMEVIVELNFIFIILLVSSQVLDDYFSTVLTPDACGIHGRGVATSTWILTPFYYFPLILFVSVPVVYIILLLRRLGNSFYRRKFQVDLNKVDDGLSMANYALVPSTTQVIELTESPDHDSEISGSYALL